MIKNILIIFVLVLFTNQVMANSAKDNNLVLLEKILNSQTKQLKSEFEMKKIIDHDHSISSYGEIIFSTNSGICWITKKPVNRLWYISNEGEIYNTYIDDPDIANPQKKQKSSSIGLKMVMKQFLTIFKNNKNELAAAYNIVITPANEYTDIYELNLQPKDEQVRQAIQNIVITTEKTLIKNIRITEKKEGSTEIKFGSSEEISDENFDMKAYCHE